MSGEKEIYIQQWIAIAESDFLAAQLLAKGDPDSVASIVGFHCQQSIEKFLKAFLVYKDFHFKKTHDLEELRDKCAEYDRDFQTLDFFNLTDYAVEYRYPTDDLTPGKEEINHYLNLVQKTKELVNKKIKLN
jgi:HEPN domain-containing protein